jgi:hypothetical protein
VDANRIAQKVTLELVRRIFHTNLIILTGQWIDIILRMCWMKLHKAVLDIAARLVHLNSSVNHKVILHLPVISHIKVSLHHVVQKRMEDIHMI